MAVHRSAQSLLLTIIIKVIFIFIILLSLVLAHPSTVLQIPSPPAFSELTPSVLPHTLSAPSGPMYAAEHSMLTNPGLNSLYRKLPHLLTSDTCLKIGSICLVWLNTQSYVSYTSPPVFPFFTESDPFKATYDMVLYIKSKCLFLMFKIFQPLYPHISSLKYSLVDVLMWLL